MSPITHNIISEICNKQRPFDPQETMLVLKHNISIFWSWGVSGMFTVPKEKQNVGLVLKVNGHHHKGFVVITLSWDDTYRVDIVNTHGNILNTYEQVYFDQLTEVIDNRIEKIADYQF